MNLKYYTMEDCHGNAAETMKQFPSMEEALRDYRSLPDDHEKILGITDNEHILVLVRCIPIFPLDRRGEDVLMQRWEQMPEWARNSREGNVVKTCVRELGVRYMADGTLLYPVPSMRRLPRNLRGYILQKEEHQKEFYHWVYVAGRGRYTPDGLRALRLHRPLVLKYWASAISPDGMRCEVELEPWMYQHLLHHTLQCLADEARKNKEEENHE